MHLFSKDNVHITNIQVGNFCGKEYTLVIYGKHLLWQLLIVRNAVYPSKLILFLVTQTAFYMEVLVLQVPLCDSSCMYVATKKECHEQPK